MSDDSGCVYCDDFRDDFDYDVLDPGIREVVRLLRQHCFVTSDSGDGVSKPGVGTDDSCALSLPNVVCKVPPFMLPAECDRLCRLLRAEGVRLGHAPEAIAGFVDTTGLPPTDDVVVEGTYLPSEDGEGLGIAVITVFGLDDTKLAKARERRKSA